MPSDFTRTSTRIGLLSRKLRTRAPGQTPGAGEGVKDRIVDALVTPRLGMGLVIAVLFWMVASAAVIWSREQPLVAVGRVMDETRLVRVPLEIEDAAQTAQKREEARQSTPRVYVANTALLEELETTLSGLPRALSGAATLAEVPDSVVKEFGLTPEIFAAIRREATDGQPSSAWLSKVRTFMSMLERRPLIDRQTWISRAQEGSYVNIRLKVGNRNLPPVFRGEVVNVEDPAVLADVVGILARDAGFTGELRAAVVNRLTQNPRPTFTLDEAATARDQNDAAAAVSPVVRFSPPGQIIFQRGDVLTQTQRDLFASELRAFRLGSEGFLAWLRALGVSLAVAGVTIALAGYTVLFCTRASANAGRMAGIAVLLSVLLIAACVATAWAPEFAGVTGVAPTIFAALLIHIGYDRRSALAYAVLHGLLVCLGLRESLGAMLVMVTGIAGFVWSLKEIRDRSSLVRASLITSAVVALSTVVTGLIERPLQGAQPVFREIGADALLAGAGVVVLGGLTLFMLPLLERVFNVSTGLSLMELRDPKHPLLRQLQLRAPGTYNHCLAVATICESAAEAVKGDSLLAYVGALYHDVGKMNKPEYFIENQVGGPNRHDKLSPAMSLLLVVGHVKDGVELAREYGLPRSILHFIESHHGTTLVEFFYHRARRQAIAGGGEDGDDNAANMPDEFEYRYPGPKPRTVEAAILMIADAVESATRAMSEPTPSRIEALVRGIADKRLRDGQFDDCEITLRDLATICDSISRTLASMYHGRIAYPGGVEAEEQRA